MRNALVQLFEESKGDDLLFYFSGHGGLSALGPELFTTDGVPPSSFGVSMHEISLLAQHCEAASVTIILDCCAAGTFGDEAISPSDFDTVKLRRGVSLMAACRGTEETTEVGEHGAFTQLLLEGLDGAAADMYGRVSGLQLHALAGAAFAEDAEQHPVLKAHSVDAPTLRLCPPRVSAEQLGRIRAHFPAPDATMQLGEAEISGLIGSKPGDPEELTDLSSYYRADLLKVERDPAGALVVSLGPLGLHYWRLDDDAAGATV